MSEDTSYALIEKVSAGTKILLHPMKLDFPKNSVTALLGPSGAGKSTVLSVITDSISSNVSAQAEIMLDGLSSFVPQDDRLHGFFTVRKYMKHYARLSGMSITPEIEQKIDRLLSQLGLTNQADTVVGDLFFTGLSGGQKRRLSIALEALTDPEIFYLDEPTSGLDAESAVNVMEFLQEYAKSGRRVILTIHQPNSFVWQTIRNVILLSRGRIMYNGPRENMERFFEDAGYPTPQGWNPADHYLTLVNDEFKDHVLSVEEWAEKFRVWDGQHTEEMGHAALPEERRVSSLTPRTARSSSITVSLELTYRYFLNLFLNPGILGVRVAMYAMLALLVGAIFWKLGDDFTFQAVQSRIALAFYCVAFFVFMSVAVLPFTVMERDIVDKEVRNKYYNPIMYQISQIIASIPGAAILAFVVTLIITGMTKMRDPLWYFCAMFLALLVAEALAQLVSHVVPHFVIGMAVLAAMFGFFMLLQGFMIIPSEFPSWLRWLYPCAFHTYAWRTFMYTEFHGDQAYEGQFKTGDEVLVFYEIDDINRGNDMITLVGYAAFVHLLSCVVLHLRYNLFRGKIERVSEGFKIDAG